MDPKTKAFIELAAGFGLILMALFFVMLILSIEDVYFLETNLTKPMKELATMAAGVGLFFGFLGGVAITKAYFTLKIPN